MIGRVAAIAMFAAIPPGTASAQGSHDSAGARDTIGRGDTVFYTTSTRWLQPRTMAGAAISIIDGRDPSLSTARTIAEALTARLPGVSVLRESGSAGGLAAIRLRGPTSGLALDAPLIFVDGVRVHSAERSRGFVIDAPATSRLDDIDPEEVDRIEILRGPAAAALYGLGAARGVIHIRTRRGGDPRPRYRAFVEGGASTEATDFPANIAALGTPTTGSDSACPIQRQIAGECTFESLVSRNPLEDASPFRRGAITSAGGSVGGAYRAAGYRLSAATDRVGGVAPGNDWQRTRMRGAIDFPLGERLQMDVSASHGWSDLESRRWGTSSLLAAGLLSSGATTTSDGFDAFRREVAEESLARQEVVRTLATGGLTWRAPMEIDVMATFGWDGVRRRDWQTTPTYSGTPPVRGPVNDSVTASGDIATTTAALSARHTRHLGRDLSLTSTAGVDYRRETTDDVGRFVGFGSVEQTLNLRTSILGLQAYEQLAWRDRVHVGAGYRRDAIRHDDSSPHAHTLVHGSWLIYRSFETPARGLGSVRIRSAYGEGSDYRGISDPEYAFVILFTPASPDLSAPVPERLREVEGGVDATFWGERLSAELTYYRAKVDDGLVLWPLPLVVGFQSTIQNRADFRSSGIEALLRAQLIDGPRFGWNLALAVTRSRTEVLAPNMFISVPGDLMNYLDAAVGSFWTATYSFDDTNGDNMVARSEITAGLPDPHGSPFPTTEIGLRTELALGRRLTVGAVIDHRGGHRRYDEVAAIRCFVGNCAEVNDRSTSLEDQARAFSPGRGLLRTGLIDDADFVKLRELSVDLNVPSSLTRGLGATNARLRIAGQNLATWTGYRGLDVEASGFAQPIPRTFIARLDVSW